MDIKKINDLPIEQVADALGLTVKRHWSLCPFHSDSHPSLYYRRGKNKYRCYVCDQYGGPIDLAMYVLNLNFHDAVCWLAQSFGVDIESRELNDERIHVKRYQPSRELQKGSREDDERYMLNESQMAQMIAQPTLTEEARHFLFDCRKLDPKVIKWCRITSTPTHLLIPYFDIHNQLKSIQWRYLGNDKNEPRFRFPKGSQCHIYNLQIICTLKDSEPLFVTEGCSDCWAMLSAGHKAIAIPSATLLKPDDWKMLSSLLALHSTPLHMYPDNDRPGERLFLQLREIAPQVIRHQLPEGCKDFAEYFAKSKM